jgi:hypothetical protein
MFEQSYITPELAEAAGIYRVDSFQGGQLIGRNSNANYEGLAIPHTFPGVPGIRETQLRRDHPEFDAKADGSVKEKGKYLFAPGRSNILYFPPSTAPEMLADTSLPIVNTEGFKKCLALWRLANDGQDRPRFLPVGLSGVWGWRGTVGKESSADGTRTAVKGPISDLDRITWQGRAVCILFDSDKKRNSSIEAAERELAKELKSRGAIVKIIDLPDLPDLEKTGADDLLAHPDGGPARMVDLIENAREFEPDLLRYSFNDSGNSERILALYHPDIRYCPPIKKWLCWIHLRGISVSARISGATRCPLRV